MSRPKKTGKTLRATTIYKSADFVPSNVEVSFATQQWSFKQRKKFFKVFQNCASYHQYKTLAVVLDLFVKNQQFVETSHLSCIHGKHYHLHHSQKLHLDKRSRCHTSFIFNEPFPNAESGYIKVIWPVAFCKTRDNVALFECRSWYQPHFVCLFLIALSRQMFLSIRILFVLSQLKFVSSFHGKDRNKLSNSEELKSNQIEHEDLSCYPSIHPCMQPKHLQFDFSVEMLFWFDSAAYPESFSWCCLLAGTAPKHWTLAEMRQKPGRVFSLLSVLTDLAAKILDGLSDKAFPDDLAYSLQDWVCLIINISAALWLLCIPEL